MARKKIKSSGLGMGLDALIKSKTRSSKEPQENLQIKEKIELILLKRMKKLKSHPHRNLLILKT